MPQYVWPDCGPYQDCDASETCIDAKCPDGWTWNSTFCGCESPGDGICRPASKWVTVTPGFGCPNYDIPDESTIIHWWNFPFRCCPWQVVPSARALAQLEGDGFYRCPAGFWSPWTYSSGLYANSGVPRENSATFTCYSCTTDTPAGMEVPADPNVTAPPFGPYEAANHTDGAAPCRTPIYVEITYPAHIRDRGDDFFSNHGTQADSVNDCCPTPTPACWPDCNFPPECPEGYEFNPRTQRCEPPECDEGEKWCQTTATCVNAPPPACAEILNCEWNSAICDYVCDEPECAPGLRWDSVLCECVEAAGGVDLAETGLGWFFRSYLASGGMVAVQRSRDGGVNWES